MPGLAQLNTLADAQALFVAGIVQQGASPALPDGAQSLALLAPDGPRFWARFITSPEYTDGQPNPLDRWSHRVIGAMAAALGARAVYPFGETPPFPFYGWALASGRAFASPVLWLVHDRAGLWLSFRGALAFGERIEQPASPNPCTGCAQPCVTACPVGALTDKGYDLAACHAYLDTPAGARCLSHGCAVRAACPVSQAHGRNPDQSAFHMRQFHP
jgi:epoxyqueuosine reductase